MSDRVDTDNLRALLDRKYGLGRATILALCDEVDRLRAALLIAAEQCVSTTDPDEVPWLIDRWMARAALAGEGDTERCPTCGETAEWDWIAAPCPDPWHSASDLGATDA